MALKLFWKDGNSCPLNGNALCSTNLFEKREVSSGFSFSRHSSLHFQSLLFDDVGWCFFGSSDVFEFGVESTFYVWDVSRVWRPRNGSWDPHLTKTTCSVGKGVQGSDYSNSSGTDWKELQIDKGSSWDSHPWEIPGLRKRTPRNGLRRVINEMWSGVAG